MKERILITGGAGFIGLNLTEKLLSKGYLITILDELSPQIHGDIPLISSILLNKSVNFIRGSIINRKILRTALKDVSYIFHLAAETGTGQSMYEIAKYINTNSTGTAILLEEIALLKNKIKKIVLASSRSIYGEGAYLCKKCDPQKRLYPISRTTFNLNNKKWEHLCSKCNSPLSPIPTKESDNINPISIYASTKHNQEEIMKIFCESFNIDFNILRFQNVYGNGQSLKNPYTGIISIFSNRLRHKKKLLVFEDGKETRDFVHINDVVNSLTICLESLPIKYRIMNIGSGVSTSVFDIAKILKNVFNSSSQIEINNQYRIGDIRHNFADNNLIKELINDFPAVNIENGLLMFGEWVRNQPLNKDLSSEANLEMQNKGLLKNG